MNIVNKSRDNNCRILNSIIKVPLFIVVFLHIFLAHTDTIYVLLFQSLLSHNLSVCFSRSLYFHLFHLFMRPSLSHSHTHFRYHCVLISLNLFRFTISLYLSFWLFVSLYLSRRLHTGISGRVVGLILSLCICKSLTHSLCLSVFHFSFHLLVSFFSFLTLSAFPSLNFLPSLPFYWTLS